MYAGRLIVAISVALLAGALPLVAAHQNDGKDMDMSHSGHETPTTMMAQNSDPNYFRYEHHGGWMYAHIGTMVLAWAFILPVSLMLSVARSRFHIPAQILFHISNGLGVMTGFIYNHSTPDLYKSNSHRPIGWVATSLTIGWTLASLFVAYGEYRSKRAGGDGQAVTAQAMAQHHRWHRYSDLPSPRRSRDSGHGTERNTTSLSGSRQNSQDLVNHKSEMPESPFQDQDEEDDQTEGNGLLGNNRLDQFLSSSIFRFTTPGASKAVRFTQIGLEKILLLFGFAALATGFVVWGGLFKGRQVFSGAAHFFKGGIFFWYGLLTLGRWMGAFGEFGWAWNIRPQQPVVPRWKASFPSAEFTESFVIFLYGTSNVFMEHMNAWGKAWSPSDVEHLSITLLFFGGGLLGMLIESSWTRDMMNTTVLLQKDREDEVASHFDASGAAEDSQLWEQPKTYRTPLNPLPGLTIMLLGIMMSSHHQTSMVSTMMHAQWGSLFCGFALARAATYVLLYIKPPTSHFPSRPPSELVTSFCLTAGGLMFMFSARDTVLAIEANDLDAMTIFTVTMGLAAIIMAWAVVCFAIKGWAIRSERAAAGHPVA